MSDMGQGCCQPGSRGGSAVSPHTDPLFHPRAGQACGAPRLSGGLVCSPQGKTVCPSPEWQPPFCHAGAKRKGTCEGGARPTQPPGTPCQLQLTCRRSWTAVRAGPAGSGAAETARGQNPLANNTVPFAVGEQEFRGVVWREACRLECWKTVCPSAHLVFFPSPLPVSLHFSGGAQFLLLQPPRDPFPPSFPPPTSASPHVPRGRAGRGRQEKPGVPLPAAGLQHSQL